MGMTTPAQMSAKALANPFWNRLTETMPRAQLDALHLSRVQALAHYAYEHTAFYRRKDRAEKEPMSGTRAGGGRIK